MIQRRVLQLCGIYRTACINPVIKREAKVHTRKLFFVKVGRSAQILTSRLETKALRRIIKDLINLTQTSIDNQ